MQFLFYLSVKPTLMSVARSIIGAIAASLRSGQDSSSLSQLKLFIGSLAKAAEERKAWGAFLNGDLSEQARVVSFVSQRLGSNSRLRAKAEELYHGYLREETAPQTSSHPVEGLPRNRSFRTRPSINIYTKELGGLLGRPISTATNNLIQNSLFF